METAAVPHRHRGPIVGREREREQLRACLDDAFNHRGRLILISGEAGIGKTTLVRDLTRQAAEAGALVLSGGCYDLAATPPYGPWNELFESYLPDGDVPTAAPVLLQSDAQDAAVHSQAALFAAVRQFFSAVSASRPLVVVLEDLHWSDQASLDLLRYLARHLDDLALLLVVTYRDDELSRRHPLFQLLPLVARETDAVRFELPRLDAGAIREMVALRGLSEVDAVRLASYLEKRAGGNPFFTSELLRALENAGTLRVDEFGATLGELDEGYLPRFVMQVIERRLARLDAEARQALEIAAVIGQDVPLDAWELVSGLEPVALARVIEQALDAHILEETPGQQGLRFTHALVREVLYSGIVHIRRSLHQRVAEVLIVRRPVDPNAVAYHLQQAGDERAPEWLILAGLQARRSAAWFTAAERFNSAAQLLEPMHPARADDRGWLLLYAGYLQRFSGDPAAIGYLDEAERLAVLTGDRLLLAYLHFHRGASRCIRGDIRRGIAELETGLAELEELSQTHEIRSNEEQCVAMLRKSLRDIDDRVENVVVAAPRQVDGSARVIQQRGVLVNWLAHSGQYRRARQVGEEFVAAVVAAHGESGLLVGQSLSGMLGLTHADAALGEPERARLRYEKLRQVFMSAGDYTMTEYTIWAELLMVTLPYRTDQTTERNQLLSDALRAWARAIGTALGANHSTHCQMLVDVIEGRWAEARRLAHEGEHAPIAPQFQGAMLNLGILARHQGEPDVAWQQVDKLLPQGPHTEPGDSYFPHALAAQRLAAELALDGGDLDLARRWIDAHGRWLAWSGAVTWRADHELLLARYHLMGGDSASAGERAAAALKEAGDPRRPLVLIAAHRLLGALATQDCRHADAEEHLHASLSLAEACAASFERALTLIELAEFAGRRGDVAGAQRQLVEAREICASLDARQALERISRIDGGLGSPARALPDGLTPREAEVLVLVAAGKSNLQIAGELFLSSRTVERHVANIYRKIGAHNRAEATAYALGNDLT